MKAKIIAPVCKMSRGQISNGKTFLLFVCLRKCLMQPSLVLNS